MDPDAVDGHSPGLDGSHTGLCRPATSSQHGDPSRGMLDFRSIRNVRSPEAVERVAASARSAAESYPADDYPAFRQAAAAHVGCEPAQVVPTAGRQAALRLATRFDPQPSDAPFLLLDLLADDDVDALLSTLQEAGIVACDARAVRGLDSHVRVTVRTPADNDRLLDALGV